MPRFDSEFVMTFQWHGLLRQKWCRFEFNFVFNEGLCLNKWTSPKMSCSGRTTHHPSCYIVRQVNVCLSFEQILVRFSKCLLKWWIKLVFKISNLVIYIVQCCTSPSCWEINCSKRLSGAPRSHENTAKYTRWAFSDFTLIFAGSWGNIVV